MNRQRLQAAVVQHACGEDRQTNLQRNLAGLEQARQRGAVLALLPELSALPYFCNSAQQRHFDLAEPVPGPTVEQWSAAAVRLGLVVVGTIFERCASGTHHNTAVVIERDGTLAGIYRKMHVPQEPDYQEKYYYTPGTGGFVPIDTSCGRLGVLICWDQWFPEAARLMALAGAELLLYPSAIGWSRDDPADERQRQQDAWISVQRGHAAANCLPVLTSNRIGIQAAVSGGGGAIHFWGSSFIAQGQGTLLAQAASDTVEVICAPLDLEHVRTLRRSWPFIRDRRTDAYQGLLHPRAPGPGIDS